MLTNFKQEHSKETEHLIEAELAQLRMRLWKARGRRSRIAGTIYLFLSVVFLILSYFTRYLVFEVISILSLLLGVVLIFVSLEKYVKSSVASQALASALLPLANYVEKLGLHGKAAYVPTDPNVIVFISKEGNSKNELDYRGIKEPKLDEKGIIILSPGTFLRKLYERELGGNLKNFDLSYLVEWLPRILVDDLKIAEKMEVMVKDNEILIRLIEPVFNCLCKEEKINSICDTIGCPICGSIADSLAENTSRVIFYKRCRYDADKNQLIMHYALGQHIEKEISEAKDKT